MRIYLAGPMSGIKDFNFPAFFAAAEKLEADGHEVFNPAQKDLEQWGTIEEVRLKANYRECLRKDLNWILDHAECVALLPGWEKSRGAQIEYQLALVLDLPVRVLADEGHPPPAEKKNG